MPSDQTVVSAGGAEDKLGIPPTVTSESVEASEANSVQQYAYGNLCYVSSIDSRNCTLEPLWT